MKHIKVFFLSIACIALFFAGTSTVSAQTLDETFFKLDISTKGYAVDMDNETVSKETIKTTAYLHLWWELQWEEYLYTVHSEVKPGVWEITASDRIPVPLPNEDTLFLHDALWPIDTPDGTLIAPTLSARIKVKLNKSGKLKNAVFSTLGAYIAFGITPEDALIYGGVHIRGTMINEQKLPFVVPR